MPLIADIFDEAKRKNLPAESALYEALAMGVDPGPITRLSQDEFFATRLKIKDKQGKTVPLILNLAQYHFLENRSPRDIIVKARQLGFSTLIQAHHYERVCRERGYDFVTIAQEGENTAHLVSIFDRFHQMMPPNEKPQRKGRYPYGIKFLDRNSQVYIGTAGNRTWGRGKTVHKVHGSEVAYWPDPKTTMDGLEESVPTDPKGEFTWVVMESTANGAAGYFYEEVQKSLQGISEYKTHFYAWWWAPEYRVPLEPQEILTLTDEEEKLIERVAKEDGFILAPEHIKWRRQKKKARGLEFDQEYPESIETAFLMSGRPRFDQHALVERRNTQVREPVYTDYPIIMKENEFHQLRIYEKAIKNHRYVIGADTAEGILVSDEETDYSAAVVRDSYHNRHVATIQGKFEPVEFAMMLQELGRYYNNAVLGVERNNHGHAVLGFLQHGTSDGRIQPYPNIYVHNEDGRAGFPTTPKTRPVMIDELAIEYKMPNAYVIRDAAIIREALSFIIDERGRAGAAPGAHDDLVFADAIAGQMRVQPYEVREAEYMPVKIGEF